MTTEARDQVLKLLYAGRIHSGLTLDQQVGNPRATAVASGGDIYIRADAFKKLGTGDFAFLLAHESRHVDQSFFARDRERDADAYGCANTWGRVLAFAGAYRNLGPCGAKP